MKKSYPGVAKPVVVIFPSILVGITNTCAIDIYLPHEKITPWKNRQLQNFGMTISRL